MLKRSFPLILFFFIFFQIQLPAQDTIRAASEHPTHEDNFTKLDKTVSEHINDAFEPVVEVMGDILFWDPFAAMGLHDPVVYDEDGKPLIDEAGEPVTSTIPLTFFIVVIIKSPSEKSTG